MACRLALPLCRASIRGILGALNGKQLRDDQKQEARAKRGARARVASTLGRSLFFVHFEIHRFQMAAQFIALATRRFQVE